MSMQGGEVGGGGAEQRAGDGDLALEARVSQVFDAFGEVGFLDGGGVDRDDATTDADPDAVGGGDCGRDAEGLLNGGEREHALFVEAVGAQELGVPEEVGFGLGSFGDEAAFEADGFGGFGVEDGDRLLGWRCFGFSQNDFGVLLVSR